MTVDPKSLLMIAGAVVMVVILVLIVAAIASASRDEQTAVGNEPETGEARQVAGNGPATSSGPAVESEIPGEQEQPVTSRATSAKERPSTKGPLPLAEWLRRNGWTFDGRMYQGWFHSAVGAWRGRVQYRDGEFLVLVHEPPPWLFRGSHVDCIHDRGRGWFWIHLNKSPQSVREIICGTESFLFAKAQEEGITP